MATQRGSEARNEGRGSRDDSTVVNGSAGRHGPSVPDSNQQQQNSSGAATRAPGRGSTGDVRSSGVRRLHNTENRTDNGGLERPSSRQRVDDFQCCDCSATSSCQATSRNRPTGCPCRSQGRKCTSCACYGRCSNKHAQISSQTGGLNGWIIRQTATALAALSPRRQSQQSADRSDLDSEPPSQASDFLPTPRRLDIGTPAAATDPPPSQNDHDNLSQRSTMDPPEHEGIEQTGAETAVPFPPDDDAAPPPINLPPAPEGLLVPPTHPSPAPVLLDPDAGADLPGYVPTPADIKLDSVYGDHAHKNPGIHLHGGIADDTLWQSYWKRLVSLSPSQYSVPKGGAGKLFITFLIDEFKKVRLREGNSERIIVFVFVILQKSAQIRQSKDIRARIMRRLHLWEQGSFAALVDDTEGTLSQKARATPRTLDPDTEARQFNSRVLSGRLRQAVRRLTDRESGGVLHPDDPCTKDNTRSVLEVLQSKHPELREPTGLNQDTGSFEPYESVPHNIPVEITAEVVEIVASRLSGSAGCGGTDAIELKNWLLRFGKESEALREEMAAWSMWLANSNPPWAAYRALMACRLVALDKQPGVRPVGIGEIYRRLWAKCIIKVIGIEATDSCDNFNLCAGLASGIEGAVHAIRDVWDNPPPLAPRRGEAASPTVNPGPAMEADSPLLGTQPGTQSDSSGAMTQEDEDHHSGSLLIDADNGFNNLGRKAMLWTVRHLWSSGARFAFNCYRHAAILVVRRRGRPCHLLLSEEGVTQGDPLSMFLYGLTLVPLAASLRKQVPEVVQPWYADDACMAGPVSGIAKAMRLLQEQGPSRGYYPSPPKSIFITSLAPEHPSLNQLSEFQFVYSQGHRYLGGFIGSPEAQAMWLAPQILKWESGVEALARVAKRFPQTAYTGLVKSLQMEWQYLQRVCPDIGNAFGPVEDAISRVFLPSLLESDPTAVDSLRELLSLPVKQAGIGVPDPTTTAGPNYLASQECTRELAASLRTGTPLEAAYYRRDASQRRAAIRAKRDDDAKARLQVILDSARPHDSRRMTRSTETGSWLTAMPNTLNGTDLSADEFRDSIRLRLGLTPNALPHRCDGCNDRFTVEHGLSCKKGGLVTLRHNEVAGEWKHLCVSAFSKGAVYDEPPIHTSRDVQPRVDNGPAGVLPDLRGDIGTQGFWRRGTMTIFDVRVTDTDAPSYRGTDPMKVLRRQEKEKKDKYNQLCLERRRHFTPLVFSVDGLQGVEARAASKCLASRLANKWGKTYSEVAGYVKSRLSVALVRATSHCLHGDRGVPLRRVYAEIDSGAELGLYR